MTQEFDIIKKIEDHIALSWEERETIYCKLCDRLQHDYGCHVGPSAVHRRQREIERLREAGDRHMAKVRLGEWSPGGHRHGQADQLEQDLERELADYRRDVMEKWCLAVAHRAL